LQFKLETMKKLLQQYYDDSDNYEIGVDEAGRGPLFGRVYAAAVILPKDDWFKHGLMKDSKKFTNHAKLESVAEYIKANAVAYHVGFCDETIIDKINILQATQQAMHEAILQTIKSTQCNDKTYHLLVDGNYFNDLTRFNAKTQSFENYRHTCIEGGDGKYVAIAAASILAKCARDQYINDLCEEFPLLKEKYAIDQNMGYGTKKHLDGIREFGITKWHRKTFGICKKYEEN